MSCAMVICVCRIGRDVGVQLQQDLVNPDRTGLSACRNDVGGSPADERRNERQRVIQCRTAVGFAGGESFFSRVGLHETESGGVDGDDFTGNRRIVIGVPERRPWQRSRWRCRRR